MNNFLAHMYVYYMHAWYPRRPKKTIWIPRTGVTVNYDVSLWVTGTELRFFVRAGSIVLNC